MLARRVHFLSAVLGMCNFCLVAAPAFAQPGGGGGFGFGGGGAAMLLANPDVVKELELTDDQVDQCKAVRDKAGEELRALFQGGGRGGNREEIQEKMRTLTADTQKQIDKVLLPHQTKRLKQLEFQQRVSRGGTTGAVTNEAAIEALGITDDQKEALAAKAKEIEQDLRTKLAKIRAEAQAKLLEALTPEQRTKWKELAGEPFDFGRSGFGGGGFGGQGGGVGGGGRPGGERPVRPE